MDSDFQDILEYKSSEDCRTPHEREENDGDGDFGEARNIFQIGVTAPYPSRAPRRSGE